MDHEIIPQETSFWSFVLTIWQDNPYLFVFLAILSIGTYGATRNGMSFLNFYFGWIFRWKKNKKNPPPTVPPTQDDNKGEKP